MWLAGLLLVLGLVVSCTESTPSPPEETVTAPQAPAARPAPVARRPSERGAIGVRAFTIDPSWRRLLDLQQEHGAVIVGTTPGSPAERAGLVRGDVVLAVGDTPTPTVEALYRAISTRPGEAVRLIVARGTERTTVNVQVATASDLAALAERETAQAVAALASQPQDPIAFFLRAMVRPEREAQEAIAELTQALERVPDFAAAYQARGNRYIDLWLREPHPDPFARFSEVYYRALADLSRAQELAPDHWSVWVDRSYLFTLTRQYASATFDALKAVELDPEEPQGWANLGWGYYGLQSWRQAEEAFQRALALDPALDDAYLGIGRLALQRGDQEAAKTAFEQLLRYSENPNKRREAEFQLLIINRPTPAP